jgi:hypothetical protein
LSYPNSEKWVTSDYSQAMEQAIYKNANQRFICNRGGKLLFNGFWRNGKKQNVCAWLDKATWCDAKTGDKGGCKDFAQIAFGMSLKEFMDTYGKIGAALKDIKLGDEIVMNYNSLNEPEHLKDDYYL